MRQLHDLIEELQTQRDRLDHQLELAAALLNTFDPLAPGNDLALGDEEVTLVGRWPVPAVDRVRTGGFVDAAPTQPPASSPTPPAKPPAAKPKGTDRVECDQCGRTFSAQGIGVHRARKHKTATTPPTTQPAPPPPKPTVPLTVVATDGSDDQYVCLTCDHITDLQARLRTHVRNVHHRELLDCEKVPA